MNHEENMKIILENKRKAEENFKKAKRGRPKKGEAKKLPPSKAVLLFNLNTAEIERFESVYTCIQKLELWKDHALESLGPQLERKGYKFFAYEQDIIEDAD